MVKVLIRLIPVLEALIDSGSVKIHQKFLIYV
jgi:hypothetical protein